MEAPIEFHGLDIGEKFNELRDMNGGGSELARTIEASMGLESGSLTFDGEKWGIGEGENRVNVDNMRTNDSAAAALGKVFGGDVEARTKIESTLKSAPRDSFPSEKERADSKAKSAEAMKLGADNTSNFMDALFKGEDGQARFDKYMSALGDVSKKLLIGGLTYGALNKLAEARSGCYIVDPVTNQQTKISSKTDAIQCVCSNSTSQNCTTPCSVLPNAGTYPGCATDTSICGCLDKSSAVLKPNLNFKVVHETVWSMLNTVASSAGYYVKQVLDTGIDLAKDVSSLFTSSWWIWVIVGIVVIIGVVLMIKYIPRKKPAPTPTPTPKLEGGGIRESSEFSNFYSY